MSRKTVSVEWLKTQVNASLRAKHTTVEERQGMISLMDRVLHETGNWRGFRHLRLKEVPEDAKPGIWCYVDGEPLPFPDRFIDTDETRREYA